jgi:hypothetical protein
MRQVNEGYRKARRTGDIVSCCLLALGMLTASAPAQVGVVRAVIRPLGPAEQNYFCAHGLAFDGTNLYLSRCGYPYIDVIESPDDCPQAPTGCAVSRTFDPSVYRPEGIPEGVSGLAFDAKRNGLWIGTQAGIGRAASKGCGSVGMPIYFWAFNGPGNIDDVVTLVYTIPRNERNPVNQQRLFGECNLTGVAYRENQFDRDDDDELWIGDNRNPNVVKFRLDGSCPTGILDSRCVRGFDARRVDSDPTHDDPSLGLCSGLAASIEKLYLSTAKCEVGVCPPNESDVFRSIETPDGLARVDQLVEDVLRWKADMECDPATFPPGTVMWVRTSPQCDPITDAQCDGRNDTITAYEIEPGSCDNIPLGACCDAGNATCRSNVPQNSCPASWQEGARCDELSSPCFEAHMIVVLDRTGSMQAIRPESGNTRCVDAVAAADYDIGQFFANNPPGSTVAIWTFQGNGPTPLTSGFVDKGTALDRLNSLIGVPCSDLTPLAEAICEAVDFMAAQFPSAPPESLKVAISSDGEENHSDGLCLGPAASGGTTCDDFTAGSWQKKVCDHAQGKASVIVRYWNDFNTGSFVAGGIELDAETGMFRGANVSDATFFGALALATGGSFQPVGDVADEPLGQSSFGVIGACCLPSGMCQDSTSQAECVVLGGTHQGENSTCPNVAGACCLSDGMCQDATTQTSCTSMGGTFQGTCSKCAAHVAGACCLPDQTCQNGMTPSECAAQNGTHRGGCTVCTGEPGKCPAPIPAVSEWGVLVMSLLVMVGGTIILRQRERV